MAVIFNSYSILFLLLKKYLLHSRDSVNYQFLLYYYFLFLYIFEFHLHSRDNANFLIFTLYLFLFIIYFFYLYLLYKIYISER